MNGQPWSAADVELLRELYPDAPPAELQARLGRSMSRIYGKASSLGLKRSDAYLAGPHACRLRRGDEVGKSHRFVKGQTPWNAGVSYEPGGRSAETRFKKGQRSQNAKPVGSYRLDPYGTLQRKISDAKGSNSVRWRGVHELVWVEANGPVPAGHIVRFKNGMKTDVLENITLDRVECVSLAENMRLNSVHRMPKELAQLVQLRGAITRQINKKERTKK
jgi:hypothetical protein